jgi:Tfp pilus assembly protein PilO
MNKLSKVKRDQLILVSVGVVGVIAALWYFVVTAQHEKLAEIKDKTEQIRGKIKLAETSLKRESDVEAELEATSQELAKRESTLAPERDTYALMLNTINPFILPRKGVNIPTVSQPELGETTLIPRFFYKTAAFHLKGTGFYHEFGKFFADFENSFPYFRLQNLEIVPAGGGGTDTEKLIFSFDIVTLIRPAAPVEARP